METDKVQVFELPFLKIFRGWSKGVLQKSVRKPAMVQVNSKVHVLRVGGVVG